MERVYDELKIMEIVTKMNNFLQLSLHGLYSLFFYTYFFVQNVSPNLAFHVLCMYMYVLEFVSLCALWLLSAVER